ncbi:hypothetical protein BKA64DRAFT_162337 [Cadophora sp. MPI-SDFR-AT-0126]|nr:hypothetical protein BKA64DRAFT_162337 [Leotiomycetes sp. MPI-SDFR-AT-0126]
MVETVQGSEQPPRPVTWEDWEDLVWRFEQLSIHSRLQTIQQDNSRPKYALEVDFSFEKTSAVHTQSRISTRKPLSMLHSSNSKQCSDKRKPRGRAAPTVLRRNHPRLGIDMETNPKKPTACFTNLPTELRMLCYELARPEAQVLKLSYSKHHQPGTWPYRLFSGALIPSLLHVCRESRELALKWYKPFLADRGRPHTCFQMARLAQSFYFDWSRDYLYSLYSVNQNS